MQLPQSFIETTETLMGRERFKRYLRSFDEEPPVSIRLNPRNVSPSVGAGPMPARSTRVPWCEYGFYLDHRPNFTFDPLLHAGYYYVQEAASMFIHHIVKSLYAQPIRENPCPFRGNTPGAAIRENPCPVRGDTPGAAIRENPCPVRGDTPGAAIRENPCPFRGQQPATVLDACAAPGGKSTLLRAILPADCVLCSNEPIRSRASILLENVQKWGWPNHIVTCNYPRDYRKARLMFDLILADVPCSGEGMFRRDPATIGEWSPQNVERCSRLQRDIVADLWPCLRPGGILIYSTCTFNTKENEENIRWMQAELQAEVLPIPTQPDWHITGSLLAGFTAPVYRFIPGITRSEGLFVCVLRKEDTIRENPCQLRGSNSATHQKFLKALQQLNILEPLTPHIRENPCPLRGHPSVDLPYPTAIAYLRREAIVLPPDTPRGLVSVTFRGHHLGYVKNIGTRANNLYPKEWAIKSTHIPTEYTPLFNL